MEEAIRVEARDGWRRLTLNRPDRMNALDEPAIEALLAALADAGADASCRALLITGAGRGFCAGADLSMVIPGTDLGELIDRAWNPLARALQALPMPTVCAVNGVAAGAGASLALGCDIVLAARSASFIQAFARIGLVPDCGGTHHLPRLIGEARARAVTLLADPIQAGQAEAWGLIWRAVDDAMLMEQAEALTARLAAGPTQAYRLARHAIAAAAGNTLDRQLEVERDAQRRAGATPDFVEGVRAFREKRPPRFTGRPA
ncbi:putative ring 1,2-epoxyphenylacetyl-CoA isomerase (oxepin-CoA forming) [Rhodovastum atsumiense]|uniref:2-(1,2-epoxy-1,2-dihydrophenyl)acetyl-CoA isomerase n=1 Tax=Rhodovastum atsumiense TaxID=504468 RepID=A0A5M6IMM3_9PROT|nr:enoyl-CoA hydratase-related protein [Rhodovastum atsumiense]KAA5608798.1 2-(1,2-epoxy-1,2-dihydrophenyl)acetyl-CoA isomerase [Rhodovastum atsumiense]CAH2600869.1 putative ring 1,2-epoxyphenylacetyl-CoA isomerase (oxepin-CoA forming) [Rhodovastum atsumiense]